MSLFELTRTGAPGMVRRRRYPFREGRPTVVKKQVSPGVAAIVIVVIVIGIAALAWNTLAGDGAGSRRGEKPPGMPPAVAAEFQRRMGGVTGPGGVRPGAYTPTAQYGGQMTGMPPAAAAQFQQRM